jgi:hypothetical protein
MRTWRNRNPQLSAVAPAGSDPASAAFQAAANPSQLESHVVGMTGFEPVASCSQGRRASRAALHPSRDSWV